MSVPVIVLIGFGAFMFGFLCAALLANRRIMEYKEIINGLKNKE